MIVAVIGYALVTVTAWSLEVHDANGKLLPQSKLTLERLVVWLSQIVFIFFVCDYMGMRRDIPVVNSKKPVRKTDRLCCSGIYISFCCSFHLRDLRSNIILNVI